MDKGMYRYINGGGCQHRETEARPGRTAGGVEVGYIFCLVCKRPIATVYLTDCP